MTKGFAKKLSKKANELVVFLVCLLVSLAASLVRFCKGSCASCGLCILIVPIALALAISAGIKQRIKTMTSHYGKSDARKE